MENFSSLIQYCSIYCDFLINQNLFRKCDEIKDLLNELISILKMILEKEKNHESKNQIMMILIQITNNLLYENEIEYVYEKVMLLDLEPLLKNLFIYFKNNGYCELSLKIKEKIKVINIYREN